MPNVRPRLVNRGYPPEEYPIEARLVTAIEREIVARGLDVASVARLAGITRCSLHEYFARRNHVRLDALAHIAKTLDLRLHAVFRRDVRAMDVIEEEAGHLSASSLRPLLAAAAGLTDAQIEALAPLLGVASKMTPAQLAQLAGFARVILGTAG